jgi:hypothetical protein
MGHHAMIGILPKKNNEVKTEDVLVDGHSGNYEIFPFLSERSYKQVNDLDQILEILSESKLFYLPQGSLELTQEEMTSLKINLTFLAADEQIQYLKSIDDISAINDLSAIKLSYDNETKGPSKIVYSDEYRNNENWSDINTLESALLKIKLISYGQLKRSIKNNIDEAYYYFRYEHVNFLHYSLRTLERFNKADQAALIFYTE